MISKAKINEIAREFKNLENNYLMGVIFNSETKELRVGMIVPDSLKENDAVVMDYKDKIETVKGMVVWIETRVN